ncbi:MAG: hypothetical protein MUO50_13750, partial [Longimicrobiales bacterium]|nr:hypothetical protein [Longimicrobiales bacterium]
SGTSHRSPDPVTGDRDSPRAVLDALKTRVMAALALEFDEDLSPYLDQTGSIPTWEATQEFLRGQEDYLVPVRKQGYWGSVRVGAR